VAGKYNLVGKITHNYGSVYALAVTEQYIIAGETSHSYYILYFSRMTYLIFCEISVCFLY